MAARHMAGIILVGIFMTLPGWFIVWSNPILGGSLIIFSFILQQLLVRASKKDKYNRSLQLDNGKQMMFKSVKERNEYAKRYLEEQKQTKGYKVEDLN